MDRIENVSLELATLPPGPADEAISREEQRIRELGETDARRAYLAEVSAWLWTPLAAE
jgi:hypothetical protein